jgi:hypothetical protein
MEKLSVEKNDEKNPENVSILEKILRQTKDPKLATVLALDLMLVGVDTVSSMENLIIANSINIRFLIRHLSL